MHSNISKAHAASTSGIGMRRKVDPIQGGLGRRLWADQQETLALRHNISRADKRELHRREGSLVRERREIKRLK
jgi:hypothetical protein